MWYVPTLFLSQSAHISPCIALLSLMRKLVVLYSTAYDPLYSTFYPVSRLQAVVLLSSEPMQQIVQVNGKKEERLGQRKEKGLLRFLLLGSTLISSPLPSVHILPCLKRKIRDCLQSIY